MRKARKALNRKSSYNRSSVHHLETGRRNEDKGTQSETNPQEAALKVTGGERFRSNTTNHNSLSPAKGQYTGKLELAKGPTALASPREKELKYLRVYTLNSNRGNSLQHNTAQSDCLKTGEKGK